MAAHKNHTRNFADPNGLTYAEQAKSINAAMVWCTKAVTAHMRTAAAEGRDAEAVRNKCMSQVERLLSRIRGL